MSSAKPPTATGKTFPSITECDVAAVNHRSIAADLDGTLLISRSSFPYFMLVAIEAGSLLRGLALLLSFPIIAIAYIFVSESLAIQMLIYISYAGLKVRDIELVSRAVLPRFYAADVRADSYKVFEKCDRKVVVTANPTVMVDHFVREYLGGDKVLGTEIEVNPKTKRATGFVKSPGVLVGKWKRLAILKEFGDESPDIGIGDRESDHDFMSICKAGFMVHSNNSASPVQLDRLKSRIIFHDGRLVQPPTPFNALITYLWLPFGFALSLIRVYFNLPLPERIVRYTYRMLGINLVIRGNPPPPPSPGSPGNLYVCNHRTAVDFKNAFHCNMKYKSAKELAEHSLQCNFMTMSCTNGGCKARFCASQLEKHDSLCPFKMLPCEQQCSGSIIRREMDKHCMTVCPMKLVNCSFYAVGCQYIIPQSTIEQHCMENVHSHLLYVLQVIHKNASIEDLKKRVAQLEESAPPGRLAKAQDARMLKFAIKDLEAELGPLKVNSKIKVNEDQTESPFQKDCAELASRKVLFAESPSKNEEFQESPNKKEEHIGKEECSKSLAKKEECSNLPPNLLGLLKENANIKVSEGLRESPNEKEISQSATQEEGDVESREEREEFMELHDKKEEQLQKEKSFKSPTKKEECSNSAPDHPDPLKENENVKVFDDHTESPSEGECSRSAGQGEGCAESPGKREHHGKEECSISPTQKEECSYSPPKQEEYIKSAVKKEECKELATRNEGCTKSLNKTEDCGVRS